MSRKRYSCLMEVVLQNETIESNLFEVGIEATNAATAKRQAIRHIRKKYAKQLVSVNVKRVWLKGRGW